MKKTHLFLAFTLSISTHTIYAQKISATVIDSETRLPVPYVTIKYGEFKGVITNDEGNFTIHESATKIDSIHISSVGYATQNLTPKILKDTIALLPKKIELSKVFLTNKNYTVGEIIEKIEENLTVNYESDYTKNRFFMRESYHQKMKRFQFDYIKSSIKELSKKLIDSMAALVPGKSKYYNETLGDFYKKPNDGKFKITLIKASKLYDKNNDATSDALQKKFSAILKKNIKQNSYLKIKSGWFGSKVSVDSILPEKEKGDSLLNKVKAEKKEQKSYFISRKNKISKLVKNLFFEEDSKINIIHKSNRYEFTLNGIIEFQDDLAYVITFKPKRSEDLKGTLYVNTDDFAVLRIDYENVNAIYNKLFNLLGLRVNHISYKGTTVFNKGNNNKYHLKYVNHTDIHSLKIDRPLSFIEKNKHVKGRRKQNELKLKMHIHSINENKKELIVFDTKSINTLNDIKENKDIEIKYFSKYNSDYWKGYNVIEPNQAIKEFKTVDVID